MKQYLDIVKYVLENGKIKDDRTGTGTLSSFGYQTRFDLSIGKFPLVTVKKTWFKGIIHELLWILSGDTNIKYLNKNNVHIWDDWADENGDLGLVYGRQWRRWNNEIDQIQNVINEIKVNPNSRRLIINAWNVSDIDKMALPPCHMMFQFYVIDNTLSCHLYQRSADIFLGVPFNIAEYSLLTMMIAQCTNLKLGEFVYTLGDLHLYKNHIELAKEMITREPYELPYVTLNTNITDIDDFKYDDIILHDYNFHPTMKASVSV